MGAELNRLLPGSKVIPPDEDGALTRSGKRIPGALPLDALIELEGIIATLTDDERRHFIPRAQGGETGEYTWHFHGRRRERARISAWLRKRRRGVLVVTGAAGSGKSALLGDLIVRAHPNLRAVLQRHGLIEEIPADEGPPDECIDLSMLLTGATVADVVQQILGALDLPPDVLGASADAQVKKLVEAITVRGRPFTVLLDGLDEAQEPVALAGVLVGALANVEGVRIIVGTRRSTRDAPDSPDSDQTLIQALPRRATVVHVNHDSQAIDAYVRHRLNTAVAAGSLTATDNAITSAAWIASGRGQPFLYARLAVYEILSNPQLLDGAHFPDLTQLLTADHAALFAFGLNRLAKATPAAQPLLRALALAEGRGIPALDGIWTAAATALAGFVITENDLASLLRQAAPYLMLDTEYGQTVYRLAHRTFQTQLAGECGPRHQQLLLEAFSAAAPPPNSAMINPYLEYHLSRHALLAGAVGWKLLAEKPDLLDRLNPRAVAIDAFSSRASLPPQITGVAYAYEQLERLLPALRRPTRELATLRVTGVPPNREGASTWTLAWSKLAPGRTPIDLRGNSTGIIALAVMPAAQGNVLLASGSADGAVQLWDARTGEAARRPFLGHDGWVRAVTAMSLNDGNALLASGGADGAVRLWDPDTGCLLAAVQTGHPGGVWTLATVPCSTGETLLAAGGADGIVRLWDPLTAAPPIELHGHTGAVLALTVVADAGNERPLLVSGGIDGTIRLWDPISRAARGEPMRSVGHAVRALAAVPAGGDTYVAAGSADGAVYLWNPRTGEAVGLASCAHSTAVLALAAVLTEAAPLLASGRADGTVRLGSVDGRLAQETLLACPSPLRSIVVAERQLVAATQDGLHALALPSVSA
ncbi:NACHT and WD repeat domain-containing protein [Micromonospora coxensis]|uniref:NACHT and WD repeat domain-containing protein n=1 Tax=Micromonospora coxensis TaxID=356852 RepID=UPI00156120DB|nr:WD40 repeat domain-containing protein [Micromonospora coxensis]